MTTFGVNVVRFLGDKAVLTQNLHSCRAGDVAMRTAILIHEALCSFQGGQAALALIAARGGSAAFWTTYANNIKISHRVGGIDSLPRVPESHRSLWLGHFAQNQLVNRNTLSGLLVIVGSSAMCNV